MPKIIISDTSCLIVLSKIGALDLLQKVYGKIYTTIDIVIEYGEELPDWIEILKVKDKYSQQLLEIQIDKGESSAIALALENQNSVIILDDYKARKVADKLKICYTGTLGVIIKAKLNGVIPSIKPILEKIKQTNFYLSNEMEIKVLFEANE